MTADVPSLLQPLKDRLTAAVNEPENGRAQLAFTVRGTKDQAKLIAAIEAVDRVCADWAKLADGDRYYARKVPRRPHPGVGW